MILGALLVLALVAGNPERLIPSQPEVVHHPRQDGEVVLTVRARDVDVKAILERIAALNVVTIAVERSAEPILQTTVVTIDLHERDVELIVDLLVAAAGVDLSVDRGTYRVVAPPLPGETRPRVHERFLAERFYNRALTWRSAGEVSAQALRGIAELGRQSKDPIAATTAYETLLTRFPTSEAAQGAELLLADQFAELGDWDRARRVLHSFLDRCPVESMREQALRRLLVLLLARERFREIEDLRDPLLKLKTIEEPTLAAIGEAALAMVETGNAESAIRFVNEIWRAAPIGRSALGPVLAWAMIEQRNPDHESASRILDHSLRAIEIDHQSPMALIAFAQLAQRLGRSTESLLFATAAVRHADARTTVRRRGFQVLADVYARIGLDRRARRNLFEAEQLCDDDEAARLALRSAELALEAGEPEQARLLFQENLRFESVRVDAEMGIARALLSAGEPTRALSVVRRLFEDAELPARVEDPLIELGADCLEEMREFERARRLLFGDKSALVEERSR